jgi:hypothetical protein
MGLYSNIQAVGYSRLHLFRKEWTVKKLRLRIYELMRPLIKNVIGQRGGKVSERELQREYDSIFLDARGRYDLDNPLYDIEIHNNLPVQQGMFSHHPTCDFCGQSHRDNCILAYEDDVTLAGILSLMTYDRELELTVAWKSNAKVNFRTVENANFERINLNAPSNEAEAGYGGWMSSSKNISIYDCLSCFGQEETLAGNDMWYCSKCKDHVPAFKKMEIYKTPEFLVVHLKRFSHQKNSMFGSRKLNMLIEFPVEGLDVTQYLSSELGASDQAINLKEFEAAPKMIYDLYAVSNHYGSLGGGHYTAMAKNPVVHKWFEFDDSQVSRIGSSASEI